MLTPITMSFVFEDTGTNNQSHQSHEGERTHASVLIPCGGWQSTLLLGQRFTVDSGLRGNGSVEDTDGTSEEVQQLR